MGSGSTTAAWLVCWSARSCGTTTTSAPSWCCRASTWRRARRVERGQPRSSDCERVSSHGRREAARIAGCEDTGGQRILIFQTEFGQADQLVALIIAGIALQKEQNVGAAAILLRRSEERRVGKEGVR